MAGVETVAWVDRIDRIKAKDGIYVEEILVLLLMVFFPFYLVQRNSLAGIIHQIELGQTIHQRRDDPICP